MALLPLLLIPLLLLIAYQDFKCRAVSVITLVLLGVGSCLIGLAKAPAYLFFWSSSINFFFLLTQFLCITFYFSIKERKVVNICKHYLGLGDVLFLLCLCALLPTDQFLFFYLSSLFVTLLFFCAFRLLTQKSSFTIPLAGVQALLLIIFLLLPEVWLLKAYSLSPPVVPH